MARSPKSSDVWPTAHRPWGAAWRDHSAVARDSVAFVSARLGTTLLVWLLVGIALAFPAGVYLLDRNLAHATGDWQGVHGFSIYFKVDAQVETAADLAHRLGRETDIDTVRLITPDEALRELRGHLGAADVLATLSENPLPATVRAAAKANVPVGRLERLARRLEQEDGVDAVVVEKAWLERLAAIRTLIGRVGWIAAILFGVGAVLVSSSSIRLAIEVRLPELQVYALVGAGRRYMGRPFRYLGVIYGAGGGIVAALLVAAALAWLDDPLQRLFASTAERVPIAGFDGAFVLALVCVGVALGVFGSAFAVRQRLRALDVA